jgi:alanine racemase
MNERIKELERQATETVKCGLNGTSTTESFNRKKFAELIIQECILTIQMGITRDGHNTEKYLRSIKHIKQIKEHFGVEL